MIMLNSHKHKNRHMIINNQSVLKDWRQKGFWKIPSTAIRTHYHIFEASNSSWLGSFWIFHGALVQQLSGKTYTHVSAYSSCLFCSMGLVRASLCSISTQTSPRHNVCPVKSHLYHKMWVWEELFFLTSWIWFFQVLWRKKKIGWASNWNFSLFSNLSQNSSFLFFSSLSRFAKMAQNLWVLRSNSCYMLLKFLCVCVCVCVCVSVCVCHKDREFLGLCACDVSPERAWVFEFFGAKCEC